MDDNLKKVLAEYLSTLLDAIKTGAGFAKEQIPLVIQEKLRYDLAFNLVWLTVVTILYVAINTVVYKSSKEERDKIALRTMCFFFTTAVYIMIGGSFISDALKIYLAPRLYIVEWLSHLAK